jgi:hypothetical protein
MKGDTIPVGAATVSKSTLGPTLPSTESSFPGVKPREPQNDFAVLYLHTQELGDVLVNLVEE